MTESPPLPKTSAAIPDDVVLPAADPHAVPPRPGVFGALFILATGAVVALCALTLTVAVLVVRYTALPLPREYVLPGVFATAAPVGLAFFSRVWWRALKSRERDADRWLGLSLPFFVVMGAAGGIGMAGAVRPPEDRGYLSFRDARVCEGLTSHAGGALFEACERVAAACQREAIAASRDWDDYVACATVRWHEYQEATRER